jgi:hypothetical protein
VLLVRGSDTVASPAIVPGCAADVPARSALAA